MVSISQPQLQPGRFDSYVEELHDFARGYKLRYGTPEDLHGLRAALDGVGPFREECASMLRSMVYRERGKAPPDELLALVAIAWGGPHIRQSEVSLQEPLVELSRFVAGVMRPSRDTAAPSTPESVLAPVDIALPAVGTAPTSRQTLPAPALSRQTRGIFTAAAQTSKEGRQKEHTAVDSGDTHPETSAPEDLITMIKLLETRSPEVQLYLRLLEQREGMRKLAVGPAYDSPPVMLDERAITHLSVDRTPSNDREDPWDENSELQRELRRFAADRATRAAEYQAFKAAHASHIKILFILEGMIFRFAGPNNFLRRYLSESLRLPHSDI